MHECLLTTPRFTVERRVYPAADSEPINRYIVVHPGAVVVLPLLDPETVVMIRQMRRGVDEELWELPAGTLEPGEMPPLAARRELQEETGYRADTMTPFGQFFTSPGICTERMYAFVARDLEPVGQKLDAGECIRVITRTLAQVRRMILDDDIRDGKTLAVFGRYFLQSPL